MRKLVVVVVVLVALFTLIRDFPGGTDINHSRAAIRSSLIP